MKTKLSVGCNFSPGNTSASEWMGDYTRACCRKSSRTAAQLLLSAAAAVYWDTHNPDHPSSLSMLDHMTQHADLMVWASGGGSPHIDILLSQWCALLWNHAYVVARKSMLIAEQLCSVIFTACSVLEWCCQGRNHM